MSSSSSASFNRSNVCYQSLPINSSTKLGSQKNVNFKSTNETVTVPEAANKFQSSINTEEFAKLDALLEDLLAEVDQPILLNHKESTTADIGQTQQRNPFYVHQSSHNQVDRSVDWLNEQKELLRTRKEAAAAQQPYRKIKAKLDYYISSSTIENGEPIDQSAQQQHLQIPIINNKPPVSPSTRQLYSPTTTTTMTNVTQIPIHQQSVTNGQTLTNSFRSLSTNPALLVIDFKSVLK